MISSDDTAIINIFGGVGGASELLFWSFRYFLGRQTGETIDFAENLAKAWPFLAKKDQDMIRKELDLTFENDDKMRADFEYPYNIYPLGSDIDRAAWDRVRKIYQQ